MFSISPDIIAVLSVALNLNFGESEILTGKIISNRFSID